MQSIPLSVNNNFHASLDQTEVVNLNNRMENNRALLNDLKASKPFQNLLILMRKAAVPDERLLDFLTRKASLETCFGDKTWKIALLTKTYDRIEVHSSGSHFLLESLATELSAIFKKGIFFESADKFHSKMKILMSSIEKSNGLKRLDLVGADLSGINLSEANLIGANLHKANLSGVDLTGANLSDADVSDADLHKANLSSAYLHEANLSGANLAGARLSAAFLPKANLSRTNLSRADLTGTKLYKANLSEADLSGSFLSGANLSGANLSKANLSDANVSYADLSATNLCGADLRVMKVKVEQLVTAKLIGARSEDDGILAMIRTQERKETWKKYQLLPYIVREFTFDSAHFPQELIAIIGRDLD
jgi:uncharacterized protein YjbI with pentapeptide repeats